MPDVSDFPDWENIAAEDGCVFDEQAQLYRATTKGIPAKKLGDVIELQVCAVMVDGSFYYSDTVYYSPKEYAYSMVQSGSDQMKSLAVAMLNYGAAAQTYFGYKTGELINSNLTAEQKGLVEDYRSDMFQSAQAPTADKQGQFSLSTNITSRQRTVNFDGAFGINYYCVFSQTPVADSANLYFWDSDTYDAVDALTPGNATGCVPMTKQEDEVFCGTIAGIAAKDLESTVYVAFRCLSDSGEIYTDLQSYSLASYCVASAAKGTEFSPLAAATAVYGHYAKQYFYG